MGLCLGLWISSWSPNALANQQTTPPRPKIGLALSGGGARGMAHIGVLEAFEELRIPIDYIAGTSMGSIIGGLYASGMTTPELRESVGNLDWKKLLRYKIDRNQLSYRDKQTQGRYFNFEFGVNDSGLTVPSGVINGQELLLFFKRLTRNINIDNFAKLPIPFQAVATDIENPNTPQYLLAKGDLAMALRASMAVPLAFAPVTIDGHLLVDGGIVNNLPVDVVKNMGADLVIAVDIATPLLDHLDSSSSLVTIAKQAMDISLVQNALQARKQADFLIEPNLTGLNLTDFDKSSAMIAKGYQAVMAQRAIFKKLAISDRAYANYRAAKQARIVPTVHTITPTFIQIEGNHRTNIEILQSKLNQLKGQTLRWPEDLEKVVNQLMSLKEFEQVNYHLQRNEQGATGLVFEVREKSWGPHFFRLGVNATTSFSADKIQFTLLSRHEKLNINRLGAEWVNEFEVGTGYLFRSEFYQPLDYERHFFTAPFATIERSFPEVFKQQRGIASYDMKKWQLGLEVGVNFNNHAEWRSGIQHNHTNARLRIGDSTLLPTGSLQENLLTVKFGYDDLDDKVFATQGLKINLEGRFYHKMIGSDLNYQQGTIYARQHSPLGTTITLVSDLTCATSFNSKPPEYQNFSAGGFDLLSGYPTDELAGRQVLVIRLGGLINTSYLPKFGANETRLLALVHAGNVWDRLHDIDITDLHYGGTAAIVWETQFGTIRLGTGYTDNGSFRYNLSLGSFFN